MEIVFDKGVESIHFVYYHYLVVLCQSMKSLLAANNIDTIVNKQIENCININYAIICDRLSQELDCALDCLSANKMAFNEIRYTKLSTHIMYMQALKENVNKSNRDKFEKVYKDLDLTKSRLNCFMKLY